MLKKTFPGREVRGRRVWGSRLHFSWISHRKLSSLPPHSSNAPWPPGRHKGLQAINAMRCSEKEKSEYFEDGSSDLCFSSQVTSSIALIIWLYLVIVTIVMTGWYPLNIFQLQKLICIICPILCPIADPMRFLQGISLRIDMNFQILETKTCRPEAPS